MSEDVKPEDARRLNVKAAILKAKAHLTDLMEGESYNNLGLEQVKFDDRNSQWLVTLGFNRPWDSETERQNPSLYSVSGPTTIKRQMRTYKKVILDGQTGDFISMED